MKSIRNRMYHLLRTEGILDPLMMATGRAAAKKILKSPTASRIAGAAVGGAEGGLSGAAQGWKVGAAASRLYRSAYESRFMNLDAAIQDALKR